MRTFTMVPTRIWRNETLRALPDDLHRYLYHYLLAGPHQTLIGAYYLPDGYGCDDLNWIPDDYVARRSVLEKSDLIVFDPNTSEVMIRNWFIDNPAVSHQQAVGAEHRIAQIASKKIYEAVWVEFQAMSEKLDKAREFPYQAIDPGPSETTVRLNELGMRTK